MAVNDRDYLTALASIMSDDARHASYLRAALTESPFPNAFDTPLDFVSLCDMLLIESGSH